VLAGANFRVGVKKIPSSITLVKHRSKDWPGSWLFSQGHGVIV
jgi:hypothetical protein